MRFAIVLTHNRPDILTETVDAIAPQSDLVLVVDNASTPPVTPTWSASNTIIRYDPEQPVNLANLWNRYLNEIASRGLQKPYDIAIICDDAPPPPGWYDNVTTWMRHNNCVAGSAYSYHDGAGNPAITQPYVLRATTKADLTNDVNRMCPWAFILAGEAGIRADPAMRFWYVDTDLDWTCRMNGGVAIVPGPVCNNLLVGDWTARKPELSIQAEIDKQTFYRKWFG